MKTAKYIIVFSIGIAGFFFIQCKHEDLQGGISGEVVDILTYLPVQDAVVVLNPLKDSVTTSGDGKFLFSNLKPGTYEIQVSKPAYKKEIRSAEVTQSKTINFFFTMSGAPVPVFSSRYLDFGIDSINKLLIISNIGKAPLTYSITSNKSWMTVFPFSGEVGNKPDTIIVTIDRTGFSGDILKGEIQVSTENGNEILKETVNIFVNGAMDRDLNYYKVVRIGTQIWMAENINVGNFILSTTEQTDFQNIKKYSYNNDDRYCNIFGGLYQWPEMMLGAPSDTGAVGTTRGICPVGWHVPTLKEWEYLVSFLGESVAGIKMKEAGTAHWASGNIGTNESGFTALPGGMWDGSMFNTITTHEFFWTATADESSGNKFGVQLEYNSEKAFFPKYPGNSAMAVRCIMDPPNTK